MINFRVCNVQPKDLARRLPECAPFLTIGQNFFGHVALVSGTGGLDRRKPVLRH